MLHPNEGTAIPSGALNCRSGGWMYPHPAADLAPPACWRGSFRFGGVSKRLESAESIHVCGVDGPSPRIDLAPPQPLRTLGHFLQRTRPAPMGEPAKTNCISLYEYPSIGQATTR